MSDLRLLHNKAQTALVRQEKLDAACWVKVPTE